MRRRAFILVLSSAVAMAAAPASGEDAIAGGNAITVSVNYALNLPLETLDTEAQTKAMRDGRQLLYKMAVGECSLLLETIASSCALSRLGAQSNLSGRRPAQTMLNISANAQYLVVLKAKQ
jgi:hypothetical protein